MMVDVVDPQTPSTEDVRTQHVDAYGTPWRVLARWTGGALTALEVWSGEPGAHLSARTLREVYSALSGPVRTGRPVDHARWHTRAAAAAAAGPDLGAALAALEALEPGNTPTAYRTRLRDLRRWNRTQGSPYVLSPDRSTAP